MPDLAPIAELRTAADTLRRRANAAGGKSWAADHFPEGTIIRPADSTHSLLRLHAEGMRAAGTPCVSAPVGSWIALMNPAMGPLLADWLTTVADRLEATAHPDWHADVEPHAFAFARAINSKEQH